MYKLVLLFIYAVPLYIFALLIYENKKKGKPITNNSTNKENEEPLPKLMTQEEVNEIDDTINIDSFMKDAYRIYKELEQARQNYDYDKIEVILGHDLKMIQLEKLQEYEKNNVQKIYKNFSSCGGGIYHIYKYGPIEKIDVLLNVQRTAYTINRKSKFVIKGDKDTIHRVTYHMTFERTLNGYPSNCPSCGASLDMTENSRCKYCDAFISNTLGDYKLIYKEILRIDIVK